MKTRTVTTLVVLIDSLVTFVVAPGVSAQSSTATDTLTVVTGTDAEFFGMARGGGYATITLTVVTGTDGTENPLLVELFGPNSGTVPLWVIVVAEGSGDLGPGMTNSYTFTVPYSFCALTRLTISKPASIAAGDDSWDIREFYIEVDGVEVAFDRVAYETFSPMTYDSYPANLEWSGTAQYQSACSGGSGGSGGSGSSGSSSSGSNGSGTTPLQPIQPIQPIQPVQPVQPLQAQPIQVQPQGQTQLTCSGFNLASRLQINGSGRVLPGLPNNLRAQPTSTSKALGQIPAGGVFTVLDGPSCGDQGVLYWLVSYNGVQGWTGEGQGSTYWVEPTS
jgi:uncharacterized membrane protein YgcG